MYLKTFVLIAQAICAFADDDVLDPLKSKRGIFQGGEEFASTQMTKYPVDISQVDLTYKSTEPAQSQTSTSYSPYSYDDQSYKVGEQTFTAPQHHHLSSYAPNHYHPFTIHPMAKADNQPNNHQHLSPSSQYPLAYQPKSSSYQLFPQDKQIHFASNTRVIPTYKIPDLSEFTSSPIIYGQHSTLQPSLKYLQSYQPASVPTNQPAYQYLPQYKQPFKVQGRSQALKAYHPNFFQPQIFQNPVVPQLQHFIPSVHSPYEAFNRPVTSAPIRVAKPAPKKVDKRPPKQEAESDDDDDVKHEHREEIKGELIREEINDEDEFDKGYRDAARGFPAQDDDEDERDHSRYRNDDSGKFARYKAKYEHDDDDEDVDYDDDRDKYYPERDHEGHYSQKQHKKEPREKYREVSTKSKYSRESAKHYNKGERDEGRSSKKPAKYYKSSSSNSSSHPRKSQSDSRYESTSPKKLAVKKTNYQTKDSIKQDSEFKPSYQYGFEPVKTPYGKEQRHQEEADSVAKHSAPVPSKKIYRENWQVSKNIKS